MLLLFSSTSTFISSNPCAGSSPRIKISLFLLPTCTDELILAPKIMTFPPMLPSVTNNSEPESNPMPYPMPLYLYLSESAFLVSFTDPNKQLFNVKLVFNFFNHGVSI